MKVTIKGKEANIRNLLCNQDERTLIELVVSLFKAKEYSKKQSAAWAKLCDVVFRIIAERSGK